MVLVGGNLADIAANVTRLREAGATATVSGESTKRAADALHESIRASTAELLSRFETIAADLKDQIARSARQLESADWHGQSREQAVAIEASLSGQVDRVLGGATTSLERDASAFCARAEDLVGEIETRFRRVMADVETQYVQLADAAEATRARFEAADQTIRIA